MALYDNIKVPAAADLFFDMLHAPPVGSVWRVRKDARPTVLKQGREYKVHRIVDINQKQGTRKAVAFECGNYCLIKTFHELFEPAHEPVFVGIDKQIRDSIDALSKKAAPDLGSAGHILDAVKYITAGGVKPKPVFQIYNEDEEELKREAIEEFKKHLESATEIKPVCDCGAKHTSFPDTHYDWCKIYG